MTMSLAAVCIIALSTIALNQQRSWRETGTETVYIGKYANCDYGYLVLLPKGIVGHGSKAPGSNHGITVNLENPASDGPVPESMVRYIEVYNAYNLGKANSLREIVGEERQAQRKLHKDVSMSEPASRLLGELPALEFHSSFRESTSRIIERDIVAYRREGNILYHLQLVTTPESDSQDGRAFDRVAAGFRLMRLPTGKCSND